MPRKCCVPGCKSNYQSTLVNDSKCITTFSFPKEDKRRSQWIRAIPRGKWTPSGCAVVCRKHFNDSDVICFDKLLRPDGSTEQIPLRRPKLKETAVPCIFPNLPNYLSSKQTPARMDPEERHKKIFDAHSKLIDNLLKKDLINSFEQLKNEYACNVKLFNWEVKMLNNKLYFYILNVEEFLSIETSIVIDSNLKIQVFLKDNELSHSDLQWILAVDMKLNRWSQLTNILSYYKNISDVKLEQPDISSLLKKSLTILEEANKIAEDKEFVYSKQLHIISDQVKQLVNNVRKYSSSTIIFAFMINCQSPSCYNLIRDFLFLPTRRYLQSISSSLSVSPATDTNDNNYLKNIAKSINNTEKVVALLIDEIYLTARLDYKSQSIVGCANNNKNVAKTALTFMISSAFGNVKEVAKIIPVHNIHGLEMVSLTLPIIHFIQNCGFEILCIITDNHSINRVMFNNIAPDNSFPNPDYPDKKIFVLYDFVHIFKNIWKNWMNLKNLDQTFVYNDFDDDILRYAKFQDIRDIYHDEKCQIIKKAYKLNFKSVYPSILERQKVNLADNVFHQSTIAHLKGDPKYFDTGAFLEIVRKWWDIVNNCNYLKGEIKRNEWSLPITSVTDSQVIFFFNL